MCGSGKWGTTHNKVGRALFFLGAELLFNPKPLREYQKHKYDVIDLSWCSKVDPAIMSQNPCFLLSAGLDSSIYMWNLNKASEPEDTYEISFPVTSVCFLPDVRARVDL